MSPPPACGLVVLHFYGPVDHLNQCGDLEGLCGSVPEGRTGAVHKV